tara:strand:+ start:1162 stop:1311 length:150 start_codon:yes stop_codon:yes gene_type:complete
VGARGAAADGRGRRRGASVVFENANTANAESIGSAGIWCPNGNNGSIPG